MFDPDLGAGIRAGRAGGAGRGGLELRELTARRIEHQRRERELDQREDGDLRLGDGEEVDVVRVERVGEGGPVQELSCMNEAAEAAILVRCGSRRYAGRIART